MKCRLKENENISRGFIAVVIEAEGLQQMQVLRQYKTRNGKWMLEKLRHQKNHQWFPKHLNFFE